MKKQQERIQNFVESLFNEQVTEAQSAIVLAGGDAGERSTTNTGCTNNRGCTNSTNYGKCKNNGGCANSYNERLCENNTFCPPPGFQNDTVSCSSNPSLCITLP